MLPGHGSRKKTIMKKRIVAVLLAFTMCGLAAPATVLAGAASSEAGQQEYEDKDSEDDSDDGFIEANTLIPEDFRVSPAKKTVKKGSTFKIRVIVNTGESEFDDLSTEEWYDICGRSIDSIEYRSTKSGVASVSRVGKVKARRRGSAIIKTTINLSCGDSVTFRTKIYVKK